MQKLKTFQNFEDNIVRDINMFELVIELEDLEDD